MFRIRNRVLVVCGVGCSLGLTPPSLGDLATNYRLEDVSSVGRSCYDVPSSVGFGYGICENGQFTVGQAENHCVGTNPARAFRRDLL